MLKSIFSSLWWVLPEDELGPFLGERDPDGELWTDFYSQRLTITSLEYSDTLLPRQRNLHRCQCEGEGTCATVLLGFFGLIFFFEVRLTPCTNNALFTWATDQIITFWFSLLNAQGVLWENLSFALGFLCQGWDPSSWCLSVVWSGTEVSSVNKRSKPRFLHYCPSRAAKLACKPQVLFSFVP